MQRGRKKNFTPLGLESDQNELAHGSRATRALARAVWEPAARPLSRKGHESKEELTVNQDDELTFLSFFLAS